MNKAIIFDFDGVLVLSERQRLKALQRIAARHEISIDDITVDQIVGKTTRDFFQEILPYTDHAKLDQIYHEFKTEFVANITDHVDPIPATIEFIREYEGKRKLAIASMSSHPKIEKVIKHFGIFKKITHIVGQDEVTHHKPNPEVYLRTAQDLDLLPHECIVIEDTALGAQAALNAQMTCYILLNGINKKEDFTNLPIEGFLHTKQDLEKIL